MFNATSGLPSTYPTDDIHNSDASETRKKGELTDIPDTTKPTKETFMEEAQRLILLARMGVDLDTLERVESEIENLESLDDRTEEEQAKLEALYEERKELFRQAVERQNGESLPPGSMLSMSV